MLLNLIISEKLRTFIITRKYLRYTFRHRNYINRYKNHMNTNRHDSKDFANVITSINNNLSSF